MYRGRLAPTPSGALHLGHARTFSIAADRAQRAQGTLILRVEDLDRDRCRTEFTTGIIDDLRWLGINWQEGPDVGGPFGPYLQSERQDLYHQVWRQLLRSGQIYPSPHSRQDVARALNAPHSDDGEVIFPTALRPPRETYAELNSPGEVNWRFRVPDGATIRVVDGQVGLVERTAGQDFGDFLVWRKDGFPAYELAVVADDHAMQITEVVRGEDLLTSTARQWLLYRALQWTPPDFFHVPLLRDAQGKRLAKRDDSLAIRTLRTSGQSSQAVRQACAISASTKSDG